ncbi:MAG TPA: DUF4956 domain-containing protein, partial [Acidimicrobiia bacterium]|nr:DUF4956 domain-containing protein [Acidimicrobiia bacterium]
LVIIAANFVAILVLVFGIYFPRHRHRDMVVAYVGINAGVLAIAAVLSSVNASVGLGIGLFGVLSIIRLRSDELDQRQVAYYFASLALGLLGGTKVADYEVTLALMGMLLVALWFGDHPRLLGRYRVHVLTLDRAFVDERQLIAHLTPLLGGRVRGVSIRRVDFVNDTTTVEVRFEASGDGARATAEPRLTVATTKGAW